LYSRRAGSVNVVAGAYRGGDGGCPGQRRGRAGKRGCGRTAGWEEETEQRATVHSARVALELREVRAGAVLHADRRAPAIAGYGPVHQVEPGLSFVEPDLEVDVTSPVVEGGPPLDVEDTVGRAAAHRGEDAIIARQV